MYPGTHARTTPDKAAVVMSGSGRTLSYRELDDHSADLASSLHRLGLRRGDVVAVLTDNAPEVFEVLWATLRSALYVTPVNRNLSVAEVAYIVNDSEAKVLIASSALSELAASVLPQLTTVQHAYSFGGLVDGYESYEDLIASAGPRLTDQPRGSDMMYSSGTTGRPKGVKARMLPIQVDEPGDPMVRNLTQFLGCGPDDVYLQPAPVYHAAPLKWAGGIHAIGGTVVMMEKFDARMALAAIERHGVTIAQFVPTMFVRMLQLDESVRTSYDTSSLRVVLHAAAPCPPDVKQAVLDWWGPIVFEYYGSTEQHGMTLISSEQWKTKRGSVGRAALGILHICDDEGNELPSGQVGDVYFERDELPFSYHRDDEKTRQAQHPHHPTWTTVGDMGYVDEDGFLFLSDRKAFVIISGGVNIYPQEIENLLTMHEKIFDVAVIGVPDPEMGQSVKAVVQLKDGVEPSDEVSAEIIDYAKDRIARFKAPRSVDFVAELPRSATGKLVKRELTKRYAAPS